MSESIPKIDLPPIQQTLPIALLRARERLMPPVREMLAKSGITEQQWRILRTLEESGPLEPTPLARKACLLLPSQTRIVRTLERKRLVRRVLDESDRRRHRIAITDAGRAILAANMARTLEIREETIALLGQQKFEKLLNVLEELINS